MEQKFVDLIRSYQVLFNLDVEQYAQFQQACEAIPVTEKESFYSFLVTQFESTKKQIEELDKKRENAFQDVLHQVNAIYQHASAQLEKIILEEDKQKEEEILHSMN